jgi:signal transduction histidine kinase
MTLEVYLAERPPANHAVPADPVSAERQAPVEFAGIVHDLGNLIQIASSVLSLVSRSPDMPAARREPMLTRATASLDHAGALVRQTLRVARSSAEERRNASVASCLFDIRSLIEELWGPAFKLDIWIEVNLPRVRCDPLSLQNAILNLVYNARDAMPDGGTVTIRAARPVAQEVRDMIEISVTDEGVGMSAETIAQAFEPFFTTKSEGMGGVGLPMVERFVHGAGGEISVESAVGAGTTMALRLPSIPLRPKEDDAIPQAPDDAGHSPSAPRGSIVTGE